jgi:hypothetical protein
MPASDFSWYPTWVEPETVDFAVSITVCENFKKDYQAVSDSELTRFHLIFDGVTDTNRNSMFSHYANSATGPLQYFEWTTVPSYLNSGTTMLVRYIKDSYKEKPRPRYWEIEMSFEGSSIASPGITFGEEGLFFDEEPLEF